MDNFKPKLQWAMDVTVWHSPDFGHRVTITRQTHGRAPERVESFEWKGLGMPSSIIKDVSAWAAAVVTDHLVYRYGVADQLFPTSDGGPDPF